MIDTIQRIFYRACKKTPIEFWDFTQAETTQMIEEAEKELQDKNKYDMIMRADLKTAIMNAAASPYLKKGDRFPYKIDNFLPKEFRVPKTEITEAEKSARWAAAGKEMMKVVEQHKKETVNAKRGKR